MSKDRHLEIDNGTMGSLFRRSTLAALGLDALDDVSEQSFEVIDRADAFAERLLGGISGVLPKAGMERMGTRTTELVDHIFEGMVGLNGPSSATDLGEWQYWLDATLLMLFDEYEDEEVVGAGQNLRTSMKAVARRLPSNVTPKAVRERVAALRQSGVKPAMLQALPNEQKRQLIAKAQKKQHDGAATSEREVRIAPEILAQTMMETLSTLTSHRDAVASFDKIFVQNSHQMIGSYLADKANDMSLTAVGAAQAQGKPEALSLVRSWKESVSRFEQSGHADISSVRSMFSSLEQLEKSGTISKVDADEVRRYCQSYIKCVLSDEIVHDVSLMSAKLEETSNRMVTSKMSPLNAERVVGMSEKSSVEQSAEAIVHSFAALGNKLHTFDEAVSQYVLTRGENAATMRWQRATDRFERMSGISDDVDRVLLRDVVESAVALGESGIVSQPVVESVLRSASVQRSNRASRAVSSSSLRSVLSERFGALQSGKLNVSFVSDSKRFAAAPELVRKLSERVETSIQSLVGEMESFEASVSKIHAIEPKALSSFVRSIRDLVETSKMTSSDPMSIVRSSSTLETICDKLDEFAQMASSAIVTLGYDDLTQEQGIWIANESDSKSEIPYASKFDTNEQIQQKMAQIESRLVEARDQSVRDARAMIELQSKSKTREFGKMAAQIRETIEAVRDLSSLKLAQDRVRAYLSEEENHAIQRVVEATARSEASLESAKRQTQIIENALKLSHQLRESMHSNVVTPSVRIGNAELNSAYVSSLVSSLATYSRIRDGYRTAQQPADSGLGMSESRLARMFSSIKPVESGHVSVSLGDFAHGVEKIIGSRSDAIALGYDEIVPSNMEWIRQASKSYPSQDNISDLTSILGTDKAIERHATSIANGNVGSVEALGRAIAERASDATLASRMERYVAYGIDNDGERVQLTLGTNVRSQAAQGYELRRHVGASYMPDVAKRLEASKQIEASLALSKRDSASMVSGVEDFIPVVAGANRSESSRAMMSNGVNGDSVRERWVDAMDMAVVSASPKDAARASSSESHDVTKHDILSGIAMRLGIDAVQAKGGASDNLQLRVGGVNFDMSAQGFVDMLAKPIMQNAAYAAPSLTDADNILFSGYASMLESQGERRTLKGLRHAYMKSLAQAGQKSAHGDFGFNTQTFSSIMGNVSASDMAKKAVRSGEQVSYDSSESDNRAYVAYQAGKRASEQNQAEWSLSDAMVAKTAVDRSSFASSDFAWVSNAFMAQFRQPSQSSKSMSGGTASESERQMLTKIDAMLDYVENKSQHDVGVFSSDDTVRVLLEALPESANLGNKGLPKWRQKDTKSSRIAAARELREALASIGASPIQGTQPFANKQFVSPNLMGNTQNAAPLFSGGNVESGSTPAASAGASHASSSSLDAPSISPEDLQTLAEDVFQKIIDSFNEELQRRRSE